MFPSPKTTAFGLHIEYSSVKAAAIKKIKNLGGYETLRLTALNETKIPQGAIVDGIIKNKKAVSDAIRTCIRTMNDKLLVTKAVVASLPEPLCYYKIIKNPKNTKDINLFISEMIKKHFPIEISQTYYDWQYLNKSQIAITATHKKNTDEYVSAIEESCYFPLALEPESAAITRALCNIKNPNKIILNLCASHSSMIAVSNNAPFLISQIPLSSDSITQTIAKMQKITIEEAEEIKLYCGFDTSKCPPNTKKIINYIVNASSQKIKNTLQYINKFLKYKNNAIYVSGELAKMPKLIKTLSEKTGTKFIYANPLLKIQLDKNLSIKNKNIIKYTTVIGLAIRGAKEDL